eukprot:CAMPEP_0116895028 /NCGR_PEP_ID=MMETSP0467-20121206/4645_1 /TAXON_ID=283647 /ORGANISM="Mesodinium pulex, Strain SPMC105" /LENGTH=172 /DNA_ID=CAMNT_0004565535 /DNA_START=214 /DNA_END=732 /DNA_ORIENTATION=+
MKKLTKKNKKKILKKKKKSVKVIEESPSENAMYEKIAKAHKISAAKVTDASTDSIQSKSLKVNNNEHEHENNSEANTESNSISKDSANKTSDPDTKPDSNKSDKSTPSADQKDQQSDQANPTKHSVPNSPVAVNPSTKPAEISTAKKVQLKSNSSNKNDSSAFNLDAILPSL